jgi:putative nucleotidyltransferase with HDIG domain
MDQGRDTHSSGVGGFEGRGDPAGGGITGAGFRTMMEGGLSVPGTTPRTLELSTMSLELPGTPAILLVEDEPSLLELVASVLEANGLSCDRVSRVNEALRALSENLYDLVFLDLGLPDGSGFTVLERVRDTSPQAVITVTTGVHDLQTALKAIREGAYDYITKPFTIALFLERLQSALGEWKSRTFTAYYQNYLEKLVEEKAESLSTTASQIEHVYDMTVYALGAALDLRDPETEEHCRRVSANAVRLGEALCVRGQDMRDLKWGSYLHDIGKIGIPEAILQKEGPLTREEFSVIQQHAFLGYSMLRNIDFLEGACVVVLHHHEKYDGSGYPLGLERENIHLFARIFAVVDAYDAMVFDRPYRKAMSPEEAARELMRCRSTHFDPLVVDAFLSIPRELLRAG